jgi:hypothetical protein
MMNRDTIDAAAVSVEMGRGLSRLAYRMLRHGEQISGRARSAMDFFLNAPRGASLPAATLSADVILRVSHSLRVHCAPGANIPSRRGGPYPR